MSLSRPIYPVGKAKVPGIRIAAPLAMTPQGKAIAP